MTYRAVRAAVLAVVATFIAAVVAPSPDAQASGSALGKAVRVAAHAS
jgi:conjugal transfer/entry exclusion protein